MVLKNYDTKKIEKRLASWLREQRMGAGLTQRSLAAKLGCPHTFVAKIENGERKITVSEYMVYCKSLGIQYSNGLEYLC